MKEYGRGTYTHFKHACTKKQILKDALDALKSLNDIDDIDSLSVPKWTKPHFKAHYRYNILGHLTPQQIAELMIKANIGEEEAYPVAKYTGLNVIKVGKAQIEIEPNDIITIIDDTHISVNHHPVHINRGEIQFITPILMLGHYTYEEKIKIVSNGLQEKYEGNPNITTQSSTDYRDSIRITRM